MQAQIPTPARQHPLLRFSAHFVSVVFHPLLLATYVTGFLVFIHPFLFAGLGEPLRIFRLLSVFIITFFFPVFAIFLCWRLGFVQSMFLRTERDRIIPYAIVMIFYFWVWYVFRNQGENPAESIAFLLGSFLAVCGAWFCNIFFKISMHAVGAGGLAMFFLLFSFHDEYASGLYLSIAVVVAGLICTARLIVSDHRPLDIYAGVLVGILAEGMGWAFTG